MSDRTYIKTTRNVEIEYQIAGVGDRVMARIIDSIIVFAFMFIAFIFGTSTQSFIVIYFFVVPVLFYSFIFEKLNNGQTPGKSVMKLRVVSLTGEPVSTGMYFIRWIMLLVDWRIFSAAVGLIAIIASEKGQRIGDMVAGTTVISTKSRGSLQSTAFKRFNEDYKPVYPQTRLMSDRDIQTIQSVLSSTADNKRDLIEATLHKIKEVYSIDPDSHPLRTLKMVVWDFNYYQYTEHRQEWKLYDDNSEAS